MEKKLADSSKQAPHREQCQGQSRLPTIRAAQSRCVQQQIVLDLRHAQPVETLANGAGHLNPAAPPIFIDPTPDPTTHRSCDSLVPLI
jgi:hypothetical protein